MTAIVFAGRTGAAFAAEIGTQKINEEINALHTFGIDPVYFPCFAPAIGFHCCITLVNRLGRYHRCVRGRDCVTQIRYRLSPVLPAVINSLTPGTLLSV